MQNTSTTKERVQIAMQTRARQNFKNYVTRSDHETTLLTILSILIFRSLGEAVTGFLPIIIIVDYVLAIVKPILNTRIEEHQSLTDVTNS